MWSTVTSTPTREPHSLTHGSNQVSCAGTKWLHMRIDRAPESAERGSVNVPGGAALAGGVAGGLLPESPPPPPQAAVAAPAASNPAACRKRRLSNWM